MMWTCFQDPLVPSPERERERGREGERERGRERAGEGVFFPEPHVAVVPRTDLMFEVEAIA